MEKKPNKGKKDRETHTNIRVTRETKNKFDAVGIYGESADDILDRLIMCYIGVHQEGKLHRWVAKSKVQSGPVSKEE